MFFKKKKRFFIKKKPTCLFCFASLVAAILRFYQPCIDSFSSALINESKIYLQSICDNKTLQRKTNNFNLLYSPVIKINSHQVNYSKICHLLPLLVSSRVYVTIRYIRPESQGQNVGCVICTNQHAQILWETQLLYKCVTCAVRFRHSWDISGNATTLQVCHMCSRSRHSWDIFGNATTLQVCHMCSEVSSLIRHIRKRNYFTSVSHVH